MRKLLLLILVAAVSAPAAMGQTNLKNHTAGEYTPGADELNSDVVIVESPDYRVKQGQRAGTANVLWSQDFSSGIPGTWTNTGVDRNGSSASNVWEYRGPSTTPDTSTGTRGLFGTNSPRIESPTWMNGFGIFDSDFLDTGGSGFGQGSLPACDANGGNCSHSGSLTTETIDLSGNNEVILEFYNHFRQFDTDMIVCVSGDGGATWPDTTYVAGTGLERWPYTFNTSGPVDDYIMVDISAVAGGSNNVKIKFEASGAFYYWMIDDIRIIEKPTNDVGFFETRLGFSEPFLGDRFVEVNRVPVSQANNPITFRPAIANYGTVTQPNTIAAVDVQGPATFQGVSDPQNIQPDSAQFAEINTQMTGAGALGQYLVNYTLSSDSNDIDPESSGTRPNNNEYSTMFEVTDSTYAVDNGSAAQSTGTGIAPDGARVATLMEVSDADTLTAIRVFFSQGRSRVGATLYAYVVDTSGGFGAGIQGDFTNKVLETDFITLTLQDSLNGFIDFKFADINPQTNQPQNKLLQPDWYYLAVEMYSSGGTLPFRVLDDYSNQKYAFASIFYDPGDGRWYTGYANFSVNALHIQGIFGTPPPVGLEDVTHSVDLSLFPNPATDVVELKAYTETPVEFQVVITNISGQTVKSDVYGKTNSLNTNIKVGDLPSGVYMVNIIAGNESIVRQLVVE